MHGIRKHQPIGSLSSEFEIGLKLQKVENAWSKCFGDTSIELLHSCSNFILICFLVIQNDDWTDGGTIIKV